MYKLIKKKEEDLMENLLNNLNCLLSDLNVFYRKLQNYHWNVKGKDFFAMHTKLEEYYNQINEQIDEVAEKMLMEDMQPLGTMKDYLENTCMQEAENKRISENEVYPIIIKDYETLLKKVTEIKKQTDEKECYLISAFMDELIASYKKNIWMLKQSI